MLQLLLPELLALLNPGSHRKAPGEDALSMGHRQTPGSFCQPPAHSHLVGWGLHVPDCCRWSHAGYVIFPWGDTSSTIWTVTDQKFIYNKKSLLEIKAVESKHRNGPAVGIRRTGSAVCTCAVLSHCRVQPHIILPINESGPAQSLVRSLLSANPPEGSFQDVYQTFLFADNWHQFLFANIAL